MTRTLREEAERLWQANEHDKARPIYEVIASLHPEDKTARRRSGQQTPAVAAALPPWPTDSAQHRARTHALLAEGDDLLRRGRLADARQRYLSTLSLSPREARAVVGLATVAFEQARYTQAVELGERAVRLDAGGVQAHLLLGDAYYKLLRYDDARRAWERVLSLEPGNRRATQRMAMLKQRAN
jgi:tetratricopeptide (TPR) repeat protein